MGGGDGLEGGFGAIEQAIGGSSGRPSRWVCLGRLELGSPAIWVARVTSRWVRRRSPSLAVANWVEAQAAGSTSKREGAAARGVQWVAEILGLGGDLLGLGDPSARSLGRDEADPGPAARRRWRSRARTEGPWTQRERTIGIKDEIHESRSGIAVAGTLAEGWTQTRGSVSRAPLVPIARRSRSIEAGKRRTWQGVTTRRCQCH